MQTAVAELDAQLAEVCEMLRQHPFEALTRLDLRENRRLTSAGLEQLTSCLRNRAAPALRVVHLSATSSLGDDTIDALRRARPGLEVESSDEAGDGTVSKEAVSRLHKYISHLPFGEPTTQQEPPNEEQSEENHPDSENASGAEEALAKLSDMLDRLIAMQADSESEPNICAQDLTSGSHSDFGQLVNGRI